jgi:hypothetical protein
VPLQAVLGGEIISLRLCARILLSLQRAAGSEDEGGADQEIADGFAAGADVGAADFGGARGAAVGQAVGVAGGCAAFEGHLFGRHLSAVVRGDIFLRN